MIKREIKLIITFHTTAEAMAMEQSCKEQKIPGRLIPVPASVTAGCGLAWCAKCGQEQELKEFMKACGIRPQAIQTCLI